MTADAPTGDLSPHYKRMLELRAEGGGYSHDEANRLALLLAEIERLRVAHARLRTDLEEMAEKWDAEYERVCRFHATMGTGWKVYADELRAALEAATRKDK